MNNGVTIDQLHEMWTADSPINETDPHKELTRVPVLHAKYLKIRSHHNLLVKRIQFEYTNKRKLKQDYFAGHLNNPEDLEKYNLPPLQEKIYKQDMNAHLDADDELNKILIKKIIHQEIVDTCDFILKELNNRTYQLGNITKWMMFIGEQN